MPYTDPARQSEYIRRYMKTYNHRPDRVLDRKERNKARREELRNVIAAHLASHPCVDCGLADPIVLEFDHRPGQAKHFNISESPRSCVAIATLKAEIDKCDVRCANCHRRQTAMRRNSKV